MDKSFVTPSLSKIPRRARRLPKLVACMSQDSVENLRQRHIYSTVFLDSTALRRHKEPRYKALPLELKEKGYFDAAQFFDDIIYDNEKLLEKDEIGYTVDLRKRDNYAEQLADGLLAAEHARDLNQIHNECKEFAQLAGFFSNKEKGILWLAHKLYLVAIAVAGRYTLDGGLQSYTIKYLYAKFLLDKYQCWDTSDEAFDILQTIREKTLGKKWLVHDLTLITEESFDKKPLYLSEAIAIQLYRIYLKRAEILFRKNDYGKADITAHLAVKRAQEAKDENLEADALIVVGISQSFLKHYIKALTALKNALTIYKRTNNISGVCDALMYMAVVLEKQGDNDTSQKLLSEMGTLALKNNLRKELGNALSLLGELHLRNNKPELATEHLYEAFECYFGTSTSFTQINDKWSARHLYSGMLETVFQESDNAIYFEESEHSRFLAAVSAGQEKMASFFNLLFRDQCNVARSKVIDWKLHNIHWDVSTRYDESMPCLCPDHNRTIVELFYDALHKLTILSAESQPGFLQKVSSHFKLLSQLVGNPSNETFLLKTKSKYVLHSGRLRN